MKHKWFPASPVSWAVWLAALGWLALDLVYLGAHKNWGTIALAAAVVLVGELLEVDLRGGRSTPVSSAVVFALFVILPPANAGFLLAILPALVIAIVVRSSSVGWGAKFRSTSRRLWAILISYGLFLAATRLLGYSHPFPSSVTILMVGAGWIKLLIDIGASSFFIANAQHIRAWPLWKGQARNRVGLHGALLSVAALMALAHESLGNLTFVLFLLPLLAARYAFKRYASIHKVYLQTVRALAKVPELAGYAPEGHSMRVAELAASLARERGMSDNDVQDLEFASLLHDVGRVSFADPGEFPESVAGTRAGERIAEASATIIGRTPYLSKVAKIVRDSDRDPESPYLDGQILEGSLILKVANDFVELTEPGGPEMPTDTVFQLISADQETYDHGVVDALSRVLGLRQTVGASSVSIEQAVR